MSFKVAVASSDGKFVNQHFGWAQQFLIFEINNEGEYKFIEKRKNIPACDVEGHTEDTMTRSVKLISDCQAVIASRIGSAAVNILLSHNIKPYIMPTFIDEALKQLALLKKRED